MILIFARVVAVIFALLVISKSYLSYKQRQESKIMLLFWSITWLVIVVFAVFPPLADLLLGKTRAGIGTVLSIGLIFVYFVLYRVYARVERNEQRLSTLVRGLAIRDLMDSTSYRDDTIRK